MAGINSVNLSGRITKDPELRKTQSGQSVVAFNLAVDRVPAKDGTEAADFPSITAWGKTAEFVAQYARKGSKLMVSGRIQTRSYDDRDGRKVYVTEVVANNIDLAESRKRDAASDPYISGGGSSVYQKDLTGEALRLDDPEAGDLPF